MFERSRSWLPVISLALILVAAGLAGARPAADSAILFIGDGMGPMQVELGAAARGEPLAIQHMPYSGLVTTVAVNGEVTDSAAASTALSTGHKTEDGMLGMDKDERRLGTILERALKAGKSAGIISNDALWGATPAGFAVHVRDRGMRDQIALQMAESGAQVMMGFDKEGFLPKSAGGAREDGRDLVAELQKKGYQIVYTPEELAQAKGARLVGLFDDAHPATLGEMVKAALPRLSSNARGFFLMVEQARVDWKEGDPSGVALDVIELDRAVQVALDYAQTWGRTLVVVTADHETGNLRLERPGGLSVLRRVKGSAGQIAEHLNQDRSNIAKVMAEEAGLSDLTPAEVDQIKQAKDPEAAIGALLSQRAGIKWTLGHTATPVKVFAFGPGAERFTGEMDNTDIPKRIAETLGLGRFWETR